MTVSDWTQRVAGEYRDLLIDHLEQTARWREDVAERFPDDPRNTNCALALRDAADYVRGLGEDAKPLQPYLDFHDELSTWATFGDDPPSILDFGDGFPASRFFFSVRLGNPTPRDFDRLLNDIHTQMLNQWREALDEEGASQPPSSLVDYFAGCGVPLWDDEDGDEA
jgi:hypothetical protein